MCRPGCGEIEVGWPVEPVVQQLDSLDARQPKQALCSALRPTQEVPGLALQDQTERLDDNTGAPVDEPDLAGPPHGPCDVGQRRRVVRRYELLSHPRRGGVKPDRSERRCRQRWRRRARPIAARGRDGGSARSVGLRGGVRDAPAVLGGSSHPDGLTVDHDVSAVDSRDVGCSRPAVDLIGHAVARRDPVVSSTAGADADAVAESQRVGAVLTDQLVVARRAAELVVAGPAATVPRSGWRHRDGTERRGAP